MVCKLRPRSRLDHPSPTRHRNGTHTTLTQSPNYLWYRVAVCPANMINQTPLLQPTDVPLLLQPVRPSNCQLVPQDPIWRDRGHAPRVGLSCAWSAAPSRSFRGRQQPKCLKPAVSRCVQLNFAKLKQLATPEGQNCLEIESSSRSALLFHEIRWGLLRKSNCLKQLIWTNLQNICLLSVGNSSSNKPTWYQAW